LAPVICKLTNSVAVEWYANKLWFELMDVPVSGFAKTSMVKSLLKIFKVLFKSCVKT